MLNESNEPTVHELTDYPGKRRSTLTKKASVFIENTSSDEKASDKDFKSGKRGRATLSRGASKEIKEGLDTKTKLIKTNDLKAKTGTIVRQVSDDSEEEEKSPVVKK
jgi:hypothetical protein